MIKVNFIPRVYELVNFEFGINFHNSIFSCKIQNKIGEHQIHNLHQIQNNFTNKIWLEIL